LTELRGQSFGRFAPVERNKHTYQNGAGWDPESVWKFRRMWETANR